MKDIYISQYHLQVPSIEIAREIFVQALGLLEFNLKKNNSISSFKVGNARLYCQVVIEGEEQKMNIMHNIHLYSPPEKIRYAYEFLKDNKNLKVRLSNFGKKQEYTLLDIYTTNPISFIHISDLKT